MILKMGLSLYGQETNYVVPNVNDEIMFIVPRDGYTTVRSYMGKLFPISHCTNILAYLS